MVDCWRKKRLYRTRRWFSKHIWLVRGMVSACSRLGWIELPQPLLLDHMYYISLNLSFSHFPSAKITFNDDPGSVVDNTQKCFLTSEYWSHINGTLRWFIQIEQSLYLFVWATFRHGLKCTDNRCFVTPCVRHPVINSYLQKHQRRWYNI